MGKQKKIAYESFQTGRPNGNFMMLYWDMLDSKAWQELTAYEIQIYIYMLRKYQRKVSKGIVYDTNKDNISIPKSEYEKLMHKNTFYKSIDKLIDLGFIKVVQARAHMKKCNIYGFNDMWQKYGTKDFEIKKEWIRPKQSK